MGHACRSYLDMSIYWYIVVQISKASGTKQKNWAKEDAIPCAMQDELKDRPKSVWQYMCMY